MFFSQQEICVQGSCFTLTKFDEKTDSMSTVKLRILRSFTTFLTSETDKNASDKIVRTRIRLFTIYYGNCTKDEFTIFGFTLQNVSTKFAAFV